MSKNWELLSHWSDQTEVVVWWYSKCHPRPRPHHHLQALAIQRSFLMGKMQETAGTKALHRHCKTPKRPNPGQTNESEIAMQVSYSNQLFWTDNENRGMTAWLPPHRSFVYQNQIKAIAKAVLLKPFWIVFAAPSHRTCFEVPRLWIRWAPSQPQPPSREPAAHGKGNSRHVGAPGNPPRVPPNLNGDPSPNLSRVTWTTGSTYQGHYIRGSVWDDVDGWGWGRWWWRWQRWWR